jgi:FlaA1/EpsC-like NDP-sugar epimerase
MSSFRNRHFFLIDLILLPAAAVLAFALRLDARGMEAYGSAILLFIAVAVPVELLVAYGLGLYRRYWRYASVDELLLIAAVAGISTVATAGLLFGLALPLTGLRCPRSIPLINGLLVLLSLGAVRFAVRISRQSQQRNLRHNHDAGKKRVLIVGAGDAGMMIVKQMQTNPSLGLVPVGFLDDDEGKHGVQILGVPVLGGREQIPAAVREQQPAEVIIAMPSAPGSVIRHILEVCRRAGVPARTVPGLYDILSGQVHVSQIRPVEIEDLLRREPVQIDAAAVQALLRDRRVLVTGAGGSIGSELCRQIARAEPACLVMLGHGEDSIFRIQAELCQWAPCELAAVIADTRDAARLDQVFGRYRPELVFHAAAHKHVPLMEENVCEAISNNILGTRNLLRAAAAVGVRHFVLISTDKAVNPTSVMGATKRVAELLVYRAARQNAACYAAVRFGNVLGSRGSVVHTFRRQIADRQAVTVTHPEIRRFFMTIPEAVQLVLQAAALGHGGEVFVLDMGAPVRILDLATDLIRLSGLRPRVQGESPPGDVADDDSGAWDVEVVFTGLRTGEKMFEELFAQGEECRRTRHESILVAVNGQDRQIDPLLEEQVNRLAALAEFGDEAGVRWLLQEIVPEYQPAAVP